MLEVNLRSPSAVERGSSSRNQPLRTALASGFSSEEASHAAITLARWSLYADCHIEIRAPEYVQRRVCENYRWVHED